MIAVGGVNMHLGYYAGEHAAALAYDNAARIYYGEFARLNYPGPGESSALARPPT
jgi:hypothetical protein